MFLPHLQVSSREKILEGITQILLHQLQLLCAECGDIIDMQYFACFPESPNHMTYRARLEGTSENNSYSLVSLIEDWVGGGASPIVAGVLLSVDADCPAIISSIDEPECSGGGVVSSLPADSSTAVIVGAAVAVVVIAVVILLVVTVSLTIIVRSRTKGKSGAVKEDKQ